MCGHKPKHRWSCKSQYSTSEPMKQKIQEVPLPQLLPDLANIEKDGVPLCQRGQVRIPRNLIRLR